MKFFPIFLNVDGQRILVSGAGECALAKLRLLLKSSANIVVYDPAPVDEIRNLANKGQLKLVTRKIRFWDMRGAKLVYCANDDDCLDQQVARKARRAGVLVNLVDNLQDSQFITPAIVDRDPVTIAIGTEGTAPVLARKIKAQLEEDLPNDLGILAKLAAHFRPQCCGVEIWQLTAAILGALFCQHRSPSLKTRWGQSRAKRIAQIVSGSHPRKAKQWPCAIDGRWPGRSRIADLESAQWLA